MLFLLFIAFQDRTIKIFVILLISWLVVAIKIQDDVELLRILVFLVFELCSIQKDYENVHLLFPNVNSLTQVIVDCFVPYINVKATLSNTSKEMP